LLYLLITNNLVAQETLKIVYFYNFAPFSWKEDQPLQGIMIDILNEVLVKEMKIPVSHKAYPWKRAQELVKTNEADGFVTVATPDRRTYTIVGSEPVVSVKWLMYVKANDPIIEQLKTVTSINDLKGYRFGSYLGNGWAKRNLSGMKINYWADKLDNTFKMLVNDRFSIYVSMPQVAHYYLKKLGLTDKITELPYVLDADSMVLCIRKNSPYIHILPKFDATLKKLRKSGRIQPILEKYLNL